MYREGEGFVQVISKVGLGIGVGFVDGRFIVGVIWRDEVIKEMIQDWDCEERGFVGGSGGLGGL